MKKCQCLVLVKPSSQNIVNVKTDKSSKSFLFRQNKTTSKYIHPTSDLSPNLMLCLCVWRWNGSGTNRMLNNRHITTVWCTQAAFHPHFSISVRVQSSDLSAALSLSGQESRNQTVWMERPFYAAAIWILAECLFRGLFDAWSPWS